MSAARQGETCPTSDEQPIDLSVRQSPPSPPSSNSNTSSSHTRQSNGSTLDSPSYFDSSISLDTTSALLNPLIARTYGQLAAARYLLSSQATSGNPILNQLIYDQINALTPSANSLCKMFTNDETNNHYHLNDHHHQNIHQQTSPPLTTSAASVFNVDSSSSALASILPYLLLSNNSNVNHRANLLRAIQGSQFAIGGNLRGSVGRNEKSRKSSSSASASTDQQVVSPRDEPELRFADTTDYVGDDEDEGDEEEGEEVEEDDVVTRGLGHCGRQSQTLHSPIKRTLASGLSGGGGGGRPLTGRYVKHGTGASEATLASLRRMLELRGRERLNGRIIPQVKRGGRKGNCGARRNKRK